MEMCQPQLFCKHEKFASVSFSPIFALIISERIKKLDESKYFNIVVSVLGKWKPD